MNRLTLGQAGEALAAYWLKSLEYDILEHNFTCPRGEIDLLCQDHGELVFVEVRLRSFRSLESPAESISRRKLHRLYLAATAYLSQNGGWGRSFRFDLVEIMVRPQIIRLSLLPNFLAVKGWW